MNSRTFIVSSRTERQVYQSPQLCVLGDVGSLTASGSQATMEDNNQNGFCAPGATNTTGNMC